MDIKTWFARAVATGLMPEWENVIAYWSGDYANVYNDDTERFIITTLEVEEFDQIQLRKDGKDLYELEWRKPTESDIGKGCWFTSGNKIVQSCLYKIKEYDYETCQEEDYDYCLLADNGQIAPTEQDFKRIYGA